MASPALSRCGAFPSRRIFSVDNATSSITDAPTQRSLKFILQDELDDWREGEMLLQSLITTPEAAARAAARAAELEAIAVAAGGIAGPGTLGASPTPEVTP